jgi:hypothetical protein
MKIYREKVKKCLTATGKLRKKKTSRMCLQERSQQHLSKKVLELEVK